MASNPLLLTPTTTPVAQIAGIHERLTRTFVSGKTRDAEYRKVQLRKLFYAVKDNSMRIVAALKEDLGKPGHEALMVEVDWIEKDIVYTLEHLDRWMADDTPDTPLVFRMLQPRLRKEPIGAVLIIGAFNYPVQLVLVPLIGAIAAGCTAVVKPSEMTPHAAQVVVRILEQALDPDAFAVVNGGVPETSELLSLRWDKILYTGSGAVGRIVSAAAAKHLTPVILELGGLNPVFITSKADARLAARRVAWGKVHNCGQICLSPDYVMLDARVEAAFVDGFAQALAGFYPAGSAADKNSYGRIVNDRHFQRIAGLLQRSAGTVKVGGKSDAGERWIEPTLVKLDSLHDALLSEEIFGPVLPYYVVSGGVDEMLAMVRTVGDCPLALYVFSNDKREQEYIMANSRSGGVTINDVMFHASIQTIPFGGVGESGTGSYRGKDSFDAFTHRRPVVSQPSWIEGQLSVRYPPYTPAKLKQFLRTSRMPAINFDRNGKLRYGGLLWRFVLLGAASPTPGVLRLLLVIVSAYFFRTSMRSVLGLGSGGKA